MLATVAVQASPAAARPRHQRLGSRTLREGMTGGDVRTLQADLTRAGFRTPALGVFGPVTERNVKRFERRFRMHVNGVVNGTFVKQLQLAVASGAGATRAAVGSGGSGLGGFTPPANHRRRHRRGRNHLAASSADPTSALGDVTAPVIQDGGSRHLGERVLHPGMRGHDVRVLQGYLTLAGYPTAVDGSYGSSTKANVIAFQQANSLSPANGTLTYAETRVLRQLVANALEGGPVSRATLNSDGTVTPPSGAPQVVQDVIAAANQIIDTPYIYAGGHAHWKSRGYDCSGAVSYALHGGDLLTSPEDSTGLESYGSPGPGSWITIYADAGHT
ncbi:MAG: peptidoglycan-binding domain-containing protein, partial [Solirubrobacteraceae bacterium]